MARIRTVKPEMAQDEDLAACSFEAQLLAVRLLNHSDDEGYFKAHPALVKASCFPLIEDSLNIHGLLSELSNVGYLSLCEGSDGKQYGKITNFCKHQRINRPTDSKIKVLCNFTESSRSTHGALTPGKEQGTGKGKEEKPYGSSAKPKNRIDYPEEFETLWAKYPKRDGSNPKKGAFSAYRQRKREGVSHDALAAGVERYARWCEVTGKVGSETVMQAKRFFGPGEEWKNEWAAVVRVSLPRDPQSLFAIRKAIGLPWMFDDTKACHEEIHSQLRKHPELRPKVEAAA